jgi:hypothetical protein
MSETEPDVIDLLAGIPKGSRLDGVRAERKQARDNAQKSHEALLAPKFPGGVTAEDRYAVAAFVAGLHRDARIVAFYMDGLGAQNPGRDVVEAIMAEIALAAADGPYGRYPPGPLTVEDKSGPVHKISEANRRALGGARTCPSLDLPSSGRDSCSATIVARRRVVSDRYRHVVATGRFSIVPDPRCRRVAHSGRIRQSSLRGRD